jgi:hypothetical protein
MSMARARAEARTTTNDRLFLPEGGQGVIVTKTIPSIDEGNISALAVCTILTTHILYVCKSSVNGYQSVTVFRSIANVGPSEMMQ